jgi:nucleotide-binding universal stress UspA family protein
MKKVLIAIDYNPTAQKVAELGYWLVKGIQVEITLIHVLTNPVYYSSSVYEPIMGFGGYVDTDFLGERISDGLIKSSLDFLNKSKHHLGDANIKTLVVEGDIAEVIIETAKTMKADLVIVGSHSQQWLEKVLMGSVAEKVLHENAFPVLVIPTKEK